MAVSGSKQDSQGSSAQDRLKWLVVALLLGGAIYGNFHFGGWPLLYRVLGLVAITGVAVAIAAQTARGAALWELLKGANMERRRVVWPNRQERNQTTLVVLGFILIMALLLWGLDSLFGWLVSLIMG
ncbi:MAG: preprotein translocase subunit SecE [Pseudomonadota bacterium]